MNSNLYSPNKQTNGALDSSKPQLYSVSHLLPQTTQKRSQKFEEGSTKISNPENSHKNMTSLAQGSSSEQDIHTLDLLKKKEANFKHMLNIHHIADIISGKRTRKPPEQIGPTNGNPKQILPDNFHSKPFVEPVKKGILSLRKMDVKRTRGGRQRGLKTRGYRNQEQSAHSNTLSSLPTHRTSKRRMSLADTKIETSAIPNKKLMVEMPPFVLNMAQEDKKDELSEDRKESAEDTAPTRILRRNKSEEKTKKNKPLIQVKRDENQLISKTKEDKEKEPEESEKVEEPDIKRLVKKIVTKDTSVENYLKMEEKIAALNKEYPRPGTYVNCDLRYFNFDFLVDKLGYFDVIIMDPPWRIKGAQQIDSSFMFSNSKFNLEYDTLSNQEIMNLKVERLSKKGFIFLWILSNQINIAYEMLNKWGYEVIDQLVWVKLKDSKIYLSHGYYFMHSFEMCLVGYKCPPGESIEYNTKIANDVLFGEVRTKSRKPDELYQLIDFLMPGSRKIELFARNHNLRSGWFSLGNQLGETFEKWFNVIHCNHCTQPIYIGIKRYKSRYEADFDLCEKCFVGLKLNKDDFFEMNNLVNEDVLHHYHSCNHCLTEPIWGTRFTCPDCDNFDLCECCYDKNLRSEHKFHEVHHNFRVVEVPILANGLPAHCDKKCSYCFQKPILGVCFACQQCPNLNFCQNCFFSKPHDEMKKFRGHKSHHNFQIFAEPVANDTRLYKCSWCEICPIQGTAYKCQNCFSFYFCEKCFTKRDSFKPNTANTHKFYHTFMTVDNTD